MTEKTIADKLAIEPNTKVWLSELVKKSSRAKGGRVPPEREEPECMLKYMRIPSTAGTRDPERSRFFHKLSDVVHLELDGSIATLVSYLMETK